MDAGQNCRRDVLPRDAAREGRIRLVARRVGWACLVCVVLIASVGLIVGLISLPDGLRAHRRANADLLRMPVDLSARGCFHGVLDAERGFEAKKVLEIHIDPPFATGGDLREARAGFAGELRVKDRESGKERAPETLTFYYKGTNVLAHIFDYDEEIVGKNDLWIEIKEPARGMRGKSQMVVVRYSMSQYYGVSWVGGAILVAFGVVSWIVFGYVAIRRRCYSRRKRLSVLGVPGTQ